MIEAVVDTKVIADKNDSSTTLFALHVPFVNLTSTGDVHTVDSGEDE